MDARQAAGASCDNDVALWGGGPHVFGNLWASAGCAAHADGAPFQDEIAALSRGDAFGLMGGSLWTTAPGDRQELHLGARLPQPLHVYLDGSPEAANAGWPLTRVTDVATNQVEQLRHLFDLNRTGVDFTVTYETVTIQADLPIRCPAPTTARPTLFSEGAVNVYFVALTDPDGKGWLGYNCALPPTGSPPPADPSIAANVVLMYLPVLSSSPTLAHEVGHAMSLHHTTIDGNTQRCFAGLAYRRNLMRHEESTKKWELTLGQAFRVNVDVNSALNLNGVRSGATRPCETTCDDPNDAADDADATNRQCPRVAHN
jgi:hypothetical protein